MQFALTNIESFLGETGFTRKNILTSRLFTMDVDGFLENYDVYADWISEAGTRPPQSLLGVNRLVFPDLKVEIEAFAAE
ncbi:MAG: Rid family hydrolase [Verrucomicrobia bacterium]|nr:Rid family hydrolase [Verrucomicrobiota bacterium]